MNTKNDLWQQLQETFVLIREAVALFGNKSPYVAQLCAEAELILNKYNVA